MTRLILSTVGTSLLSNQINRTAQDESTWFVQLRNSANCTDQEMPDDVRIVIEALSDRAQAALSQSDIAQIRRASAELNGIYGFYDGSLPSGSNDTHCLVATDTAQGRAAADIVSTFLRANGLNTYVSIPSGLSAANTEAFSGGIDDLLGELENISESYSYVCFNLVGGFKSLQAYLNTIGMFHADEIIYIFEGSHSELIRIPRLPIQVDLSAIQAHGVSLALMAQDQQVEMTQVAGIPEALLLAWDNLVGLSNWGKLVWNRSKHQLLSQDLLEFPHLIYRDTFRRDFKSTQSPQQKVKLQETLAKVSGLLHASGGDLASLKADGGLQYDMYTNKDGLGHFRVSQGDRVSCSRSEAGLELRHYGPHDYVNNNP